MNQKPFFTRYIDILDDITAFDRALRKPPPRAMVVNRLRIDLPKLAALLAKDGYDTEPLPWLPESLRLTGDGAGLGRHWTYRAGLFNIQEASAMLPAVVLSPRPDDRVLDLCAAPGNKTAQLSLAMGNRGTIIANDPDYRRLRPVRMIMDRLGLMNIGTTCFDGMTYPYAAGSFDHVLVDAPCSCEGTYQKNPNVISCSDANRKKFARKQLALLLRAVTLCRPGGRIVYSTCTLAPEENEAVVQIALERNPDQLNLLPIDLPGLRTSAGILSWAGQTFSSDMRYCIRIWPHHNHTDGFFIACLEKTDTSQNELNNSPPIDHSSWPSLTQKPLNKTDEFLEYLKIRFGFPPAIFDALLLLIKNKREIHVASKDFTPPRKPVAAMGLPLMHIGGRFFKLTTAGAMAFGGYATKNVIDVHPEQLTTYLSRQTMVPTLRQANQCTGNGHVLIRYNGNVFGIGFFRKDPPTVESLYPKAMAN